MYMYVIVFEQTMLAMNLTTKTGRLVKMMMRWRQRRWTMQGKVDRQGCH